MTETTMEALAAQQALVFVLARRQAQQLDAVAHGVGVVVAGGVPDEMAHVWLLAVSQI